MNQTQRKYAINRIYKAIVEKVHALKDIDNSIHMQYEKLTQNKDTITLKQLFDGLGNNSLQYSLKAKHLILKAHNKEKESYARNQQDFVPFTEDTLNVLHFPLSHLFKCNKLISANASSSNLARVKFLKEHGKLVEPSRYGTVVVELINPLPSGKYHEDASIRFRFLFEKNRIRAQTAATKLQDIFDKIMLGSE